MISLNEQVKKHTGVFYLPRIKSKGLCPETSRAYYFQQYRWCCGTLSLLSSDAFWLIPMDLLRRYLYLVGFLYYSLSPIPFLLWPSLHITLAIWQPEYLLSALLVQWVPRLAIEFVFFPLWAKHPFGVHFYAARYVAAVSFFFAFLDYVLKKKMAWVPAGAAKQTGRQQYNRFLILSLGWPAFLVITTLFIVFLPTDNTFIFYSRLVFFIEQVFGVFFMSGPIWSEWVNEVMEDMDLPPSFRKKVN